MCYYEKGGKRNTGAYRRKCYLQRCDICDVEHPLCMLQELCNEKDNGIQLYCVFCYIFEMEWRYPTVI